MTTFPVRLRFVVALAMATWLCLVNVTPAAAGLVASRLSGSTAIDSPRAADLLVVQRALENRVVAQKLADYGVTPGDVQLRLASASDEDVHTLATASQGLPSGGDGLGAVISLLIIVLLVILILKLMDKKVIVR